MFNQKAANCYGSWGGKSVVLKHTLYNWNLERQNEKREENLTVDFVG